MALVQLTFALTTDGIGARMGTVPCRVMCAQQQPLLAAMPTQSRPSPAPGGTDIRSFPTLGGRQAV